MCLKLISVSKSNLEQIRDLAHQVWPQTYASILSDRQIEYMMDMMYSNDSLLKDFENGILFYLFEYNQQNIGFTGIELNYNNLNQLHIHKIYVLPDFQFMGLGKKAMIQIQELAENHDINSISLNVNRNNLAKNFYLKMGYFIEKEVDIEIGESFLMQDYVMRKLL